MKLLDNVELIYSRETRDYSMVRIYRVTKGVGKRHYVEYEKADGRCIWRKAFNSHIAAIRCESDYK